MSDKPKVSERMRVMVREMLKEIRHDLRFNVMDYDSVDHLLSAIAEIEQRAEKWKEVALAIREGALFARGYMLTKRVESAFEALGDEWDQAMR